MAVLETGKRVGKYVVERQLGDGGMASVYLVRHEVLGSSHALKVLNADLVVFPEVRDRFLSEGRIQSGLNHPNVVTVTDVVSEPGVAGLVMEYVEGPSLEQWIRRIGPMSTASALTLIGGILDGIAAAHAKGIVHRDLKPSNILLATGVDGQMAPKLLDFGIAKIEDNGGKNHTKAGARLGTVAYMSPEQVRGASLVDTRSDLWSLGVVLYEMLTGRNPFEGADDFETMQRIDQVVYTPIEQARSGVAPQVASAIAGVLRRLPEERHQTAGAFKRALQGIQAPATSPGLSVHSPTVPALSVARPMDVRQPVAMHHPGASYPAPVQMPPADTSPDATVNSGIQEGLQIFAGGAVATAILGWLFEYEREKAWMWMLLSAAGILFVTVRAANKRMRQIHADGSDPTGTKRLFVMYAYMLAANFALSVGTQQAISFDRVGEAVRTLLPLLLGALLTMALSVMPIRWLSEEKDRQGWLNLFIGLQAVGSVLLIVARSQTWGDNDATTLTDMMNVVSGKWALKAESISLIFMGIAMIQALLVIRRSSGVPLNQRGKQVAEVGTLLALAQFTIATRFLLLLAGILMSDASFTRAIPLMLFDLVPIIFYFVLGERIMSAAAASGHAKQPIPSMVTFRETLDKI